MLKKPTSRKRRRAQPRLNLIPILDSVFIFIFFLLFSVSFIKIFEISSDAPIVSNSPPPKKQKKPLALTLQINRSFINIYTGVPSRLIKRIRKESSGKYDLEELHNYLIGIKKRNKKEKSITLEPIVNLQYGDLVEIMDAVRMFQKLDPSIYIKDKNGLDVKVEELFSNVVFGNIQS